MNASDYGRRTGRTKAMVELLPETGAIVVVHNAGLKRYVRNMILDLRGSEVLGRMKIVVLDTDASVERHLAGARLPLRIDHAFWSLAVPRVREEVRLLEIVINAQFKTAA